MSTEAFLFKPEKGEEIVVSDGSSFSSPMFNKANVILSSLSSLPFASATVVPKDYYEDGFQLGEKRNFVIGDWAILALAIDEDFELTRALIIHKYRQEEGFVFDFTSSRVTVSFYRYFEIKETSSSPKISEVDFLESLHASFEEPEEYVYREFFDEDEEENYFDDNPLPRPSFAPTRKNYIPTIEGGYESREEPEEDEDIEFNITKPTFVAGGNKKPLNLNVRRPKKIKTQPAPQKEEEDGEPELHIEITKPAFTSYSNKKPRRIVNENDRKRKKPKESKPEPVNETFEEPTKPAFTPVSQGKPRKIQDDRTPKKVYVPKAETPVAPETPKPVYEEPKKPSFTPASNNKPQAIKDVREEMNGYVPSPEPQVIPEVPSVNYRAEESYNLRPDVRHKEGSLINDPSDKYSFERCSALYERLKVLKTLRVSANCLFVPSLLSDDDPHFLLAKNFDIEKWRLLLFVYDEEEKPIFALLSNKKEENLAILVSFRHKDPRVVVFSSSGIRLNDPAYPFYSYENLLAIAKGEASFGLH